MPKSKKRFVYRGCEESTPFFKHLRQNNLTVIQDTNGKWVTISKKKLESIK